MILRQGADFGKPGHDRKLGSCDFGDGGGEYRKMPLRHPTQDIADLVVQAIGVRVRHIIAIRRADDPCKDVDRDCGSVAILFLYI